MRIAALLAASLLVAGCSQTGGRSEQAQTSPGSPASASPPLSSPASSPPPSAGASGPPSGVPSGAPSAGAAISDVIAWIEAGRPADPARYHTAVRDGATTALGDDIAFTAAGAKTSCTTDTKHAAGALTCLVSLTNPPPQPDTAYGKWQGGWVDFDGTKLLVGAARADPGPFVNGDGPQLASGDTLSFGDYRCRAGAAGLFCVNYAHQSAVGFAPAGVQPFGCLRPVPPPDGVGAAFGCG